MPDETLKLHEPQAMEANPDEGHGKPGLPGRPFSIICLVLCICFLSSCFSTPEWIHQLPESAGPSESPEFETQPGDTGFPSNLYIRPVSSRYNVADPHSLSSGMHRIILKEEDGSLIYYKIHTYEQWVRGEAFRSIYGEKGTLKRSGPWILFQPFFVYRKEQGPVILDHPDSDRRCIAPLSIQEAMHRLDVRKRMVEKKPLLYFLSDRGALIPMAYEEEGKIFRFGFYEQLTQPYDTGEMREKTARDLTLMTQDPHGYFPEGSQFLRLYARDPVQDVLKQMGQSGDCIQDFRPSQSSR